MMSLPRRAPWLCDRLAVAGLALGLATGGASADTLLFDNGCPAGERIVVAALGDLLFHDALQSEALKPGNDFRAFFAPVVPLLKQADLIYANLEGPMAAGVRYGGIAVADPGRRLDGEVYGRRRDALNFNYHPSLATDLAALGIGVVSTANNHAADRGALGIDRTLDALAAAGIAATGTRRRADPGARFSVVTRAKGIAVAWLACTFDLNDMPDPARQVHGCYSNKSALLAEVARLAASPEVDAVIVAPHWGIEGMPTPHPRERDLARALVEAGATAVIGTHPHVLQPWEKLTTKSGRTALVVYSTGNFLSNQDGREQRTGIIALLELTRPPGAKARLTAAGFVPTFVEKTKETGHRATELANEPADAASRLRRDALATVMQRLPAGNRIDGADLRRLPHACPPPPGPAVVADVRAPAALLELPQLSETARRPIVAARPARSRQRPSQFASLVAWLGGLLGSRQQFTAP